MGKVTRLILFTVMTAVVVFGLSTTGIAWAQGEAGSSLDTIVVSASRTEETIRGLSIKPEVITREDIKKKGSLNLIDVLADHGVQIDQSRGSTDQRRPMLRGFTGTNVYGPDLSNNVIILMNGRRSGITNMIKIPTKNIERIEIIRGPAGVQYGSSAAGGMINIITKQGQEGEAGSFNVGAGSWGRYDVGAEYSVARGALDFSMGATYGTAI